jgi:hypothetical protein
MEKHYRIVPRGIGLVIGYHFSDVEWLPWHVREPRDRQRGGGQATSERDPAAGVTVRSRASRVKPASINVVTLVAHTAGDDTAQKLALRSVKLIDFTGSTANGDWRAERKTGAGLYKKAGVNQIVLDSADDFKAVARNVAFSLARTGRCTAPRTSPRVASTPPKIT